VKPNVLGHLFCGYNPHILGRNETVEPLDRLPDQGIFAHDLEHLLGAGLPAQRPKTSARATGEDNGMNVIE
jgi:hypothetical protein